MSGVRCANHFAKLWQGNCSISVIERHRMTGTRMAQIEESTDGDEAPERRSSDEHAITSKFPASWRVRPRSIVVVDDSDDAQELFKNSLEGAGYLVLGARNGQEALDILVDHTTPSAI